MKTRKIQISQPTEEKDPTLSQVEGGFYVVRHGTEFSLVAKFGDIYIRSAGAGSTRGSVAEFGGLFEVLEKVEFT